MAAVRVEKAAGEVVAGALPVRHVLVVQQARLRKVEHPQSLGGGGPRVVDHRQPRRRIDGAVAHGAGAGLQRQRQHSRIGIRGEALQLREFGAHRRRRVGGICRRLCAGGDDGDRRRDDGHGRGIRAGGGAGAAREQRAAANTDGGGGLLHPATIPVTATSCR